MHPTIPTIAQGSLVAKDASPCCTVLHISSKLRTEGLKLWMFAGCLAIADYVHFLLTNLPEVWQLPSMQIIANGGSHLQKKYGFMGLSGHVKYKHVIQAIIDHINWTGYRMGKNE